MTAYVALLRGIAPTNPKMRNAELRRVFEELGFDAVRTVISSGNVLFESPDRSRTRLESQIEAALHAHLGAPCTTIVRSRRQLERLAALDVFDGHDDAPEARCNVTFLKRPQPDVELPVAGDGAEVLAAAEQAVFSLVDSTRAQTPNIMAVLERAYGREISTRTLQTVHRILKAFDKPA
ncbi:MAG TPA: DUF1697 domain-containing protein [Acidimicrobiales bacterium]